jgi:uncharacterized protein YyaL (SSP411 family)
MNDRQKTEAESTTEEAATHTNALAGASSAYLRSAMHQPVDWQQWGDAAFEKARTEDKPVLLDIGAVWCHWCHVMDRESYEDPAIANIINENFIPVKVDRDERADVDARYQMAVAAISGQGGWPLTAVLTPEGKPFFGGTYFPPEERYGRPSFSRVLRTLADAYRDRREDVLKSAEAVMSALDRNEELSSRSGELKPEIVAAMIHSAMEQFDSQYGGFGTQPKFAHPSLLDLLIDRAGRGGGETMREAVRLTLSRMARGGVYDQLGGGFHRYSVDERWIVPHFEKMVYDNAGLLKNYVHSFQSFGVPEEDAQVARDIIRWMDTVLSDRERGGFYGSQDADISLDDDGDYFTWTRDEAAAVLPPEELAIAADYYDIGEMGDMHHNPKKNTLRIEHSLADVAVRAGVPLEQAEALLGSAKEKLTAARMRRPTPYVDKTIYVNWNGLAISAYLEAARVLGVESVRSFALKSLDRILREAWKPDGTLSRVVAYGNGQPPEKPVPGMLDDYAALGLACLDAWETTAEMRYFHHAEQVAGAMIARFEDATGGGFFDTAQGDYAGESTGALTARRKPIQDSPTPAGNSLAILLLLRLAELNGDAEMQKKAEAGLKSFAGIAGSFGIYAATYGLALEHFLRPPIQVCAVGEDERADELTAAGLLRYAVNKSVIRLPRAALAADALPPVLAKTLPHLPAQDRSFAVLCSGTSCQPPMFEAQDVADSLNRSL